MFGSLVPQTTHWCLSILRSDVFGPSSVQVVSPKRWCTFLSQSDRHTPTKNTFGVSGCNIQFWWWHQPFTLISIHCFTLCTLTKCINELSAQCEEWSHLSLFGQLGFDSRIQRAGCDAGFTGPVTHSSTQFLWPFKKCLLTTSQQVSCLGLEICSVSSCGCLSGNRIAALSFTWGTDCIST